MLNSKIGRRSFFGSSAILATSLASFRKTFGTSSSLYDDMLNDLKSRCDQFLIRSENQYRFVGELTHDGSLTLSDVLRVLNRTPIPEGHQLESISANFDAPWLTMDNPFHKGDNYIQFGWFMGPVKDSEKDASRHHRLQFPHVIDMGIETEFLKLLGSFHQKSHGLSLNVISSVEDGIQKRGTKGLVSHYSGIGEMELKRLKDLASVPEWRVKMPEPNRLLGKWTRGGGRWFTTSDLTRITTSQGDTE